MKNRFDMGLARATAAREMERRLDRAAIFLVNGITASFGDSGVTGKRKGASKKQRHANRSQPYHPPNVDTGHLKRNVGYDSPSAFIRCIGTGVGNKQSVGYAVYLEFGAPKSHMLPRPFLRPAAAAAKPYLMRILQGAR